MDTYRQLMAPSTWPWLVCVATALLSVGHLGAQSQAWSVTGSTSPITNFHQRTHAFLGDLNGDGIDELGTSGSDGSPSTTRILNGADGTLFRTDFVTWQDRAPIGRSAAGDLDGDGTPDYFVGVAERLPANQLSQNLAAFSGATGQELWRIRGKPSDLFAQYIVGDLDLNGDGRPDVVASAFASNPIEARAYDSDGAALWTVPVFSSYAGYHPIARFGGDLDGDGCDEWLVSSWAYPSQLGAIEVRSGRDGSVLRVGFSASHVEYVGTPIGNCGDLDGDGVIDFAGCGQSGVVPGTLQMFSGETGKLIRMYRGAAVTDRFGQFGAGGADVDGDGIRDFFVTTNRTIPGSSSWGTVQVISGRDATQIVELFPPTATANGFGGWIAVTTATSPRPSDTLFAIYDPWMRLQPLGRVTGYRAHGSGVDRYGQACAGALSEVPLIGHRQLIAGGTRLHLHGAPAGGVVACALGLSRRDLAGVTLPIDLSPVGFVGCGLWTSTDVVVPMRTGRFGIDAGHAALDLPSFGMPMHAQWLVLGSGLGGLGGVSDAVGW